VYSYAFYELRDHHAAEDATERVFMQALAGLGRFEERVDEFLESSTVVSEPGAGVADISTFRIWLLRIAHNVVSNERRRARAPAGVVAGRRGGAAGSRRRARDRGDARGRRRAWQAVARLPEDRRRAVILRFVDEMSTAEIAAALGRSEGAVRVLLHRALRAIARDLRERIS